MSTINKVSPRVVSRAEWLQLRKTLLAKEKEHTRLGDQLSAEKRHLPWVKVEKDYLFDGLNGKETLASLYLVTKPSYLCTTSCLGRIGSKDVPPAR